MIIAKKILKITCIVLGVILAAAIIFVGVLTLTEYKPHNSESLEVSSGSTFGQNTTGSDKLSPSVGDSISIVTWNLGYGSLGANADFFMDGGDSVYTSNAEQVNDNMEAITSELDSLSADILLLQEVDERSSRSHKINETDILREKLPSYASSYAYNYKTLMVPYPLPPIGRVTSGIMTFSSFEVSDAERIQLPCPFSYPIRLCNLKRCLIVSRIPIAGSEHELVIVNSTWRLMTQARAKPPRPGCSPTFSKMRLQQGTTLSQEATSTRLFQMWICPHTLSSPLTCGHQEA